MLSSTAVRELQLSFDVVPSPTTGKQLLVWSTTLQRQHVAFSDDTCFIKSRHCGLVATGLKSYSTL